MEIRRFDPYEQRVYIRLKKLKIPGSYPHMYRANGTLVVLWPIVHGLKPMATICAGPMALRKSYADAN